jgi:SAM-dependent methyltransferase/ABC-type molybdate transport system substrate-binding protein
MRLRLLTMLAFALLASALFAPATSAARIDVGVYDEYAPVVREAAAIWVADTGNQVIVHPFPHSQLMQFPAKGDMDVLVPSCNRSADIWEQKGYVVPASRKPMFCGRMAVIVPPKNPRNIRGIEDLGQPGIRWGKIDFCAWRGEKLLKGKESSFVATTVDADDMMDLLAKGKVDAVLGWDYTVARNPLNPVVIRLPVSRYGSELAALIPAFVTPTARSPKEAGALVDFLSTDGRAKRAYLSHGLMLDDGSFATEYDTSAAPRMNLAYSNIVRQLVEDYHITEGTAIDLGCGPGQMAVILAKQTKLKVTGLDIEPEAIEAGRRHAQEQGLADRVSFVCADAHSLPFPDNYANLIVSKGTLPFLRDQAQAIREVYRVLKPGGVAFLGGGFGRYTSAEEKAQMGGGMSEAWYGVDAATAATGKAVFPFPIVSYDVIMTKTGIADYRVIREGGNWIEIRKAAG